jgi:hypothetical protein
MILYNITPTNTARYPEVFGNPKSKSQQTNKPTAHGIEHKCKGGGKAAEAPPKSNARSNPTPTLIKKQRRNPSK